MKAVVFKSECSTFQPWYVKIVAGNGETLTISEGYFSKWNAKRAAKKFNIPVVEE